MSVYYDCNKLLTMKDQGSNVPEIFMVSGNRTAGKTYSFKKRLVDRFMKYGEKFAILVRFGYEMDAIEETFFKDLQEIHYPKIQIRAEWVGRQLFKRLFIDDKECGYCVAINSADTIKKYSSVFVDVTKIFFDEFQSETGKYCPDEITKFISVHVSMARGGGSQTRYLPVYMASNAVTILNPYYSLFGISKRLTPNTKFLRGDGWVLEITYNENAANALANSAFGRAVAKHSYMQYATENKSLLDNANFVGKIKGHKSIFTVIVYNGKEFGVWSLDDGQFMYISTQTEPNWPMKITFKTEDHNISYLMQKRSDVYTKAMREMFNQGRLRFEDLECKDMFFEFIGYTML